MLRCGPFPQASIHPLLAFAAILGEIEQFPAAHNRFLCRQNAHRGGLSAHGGGLDSPAPPS